MRNVKICAVRKLHGSQAHHLCRVELLEEAPEVVDIVHKENIRVKIDPGINTRQHLMDKQSCCGADSEHVHHLAKSIWVKHFLAFQPEIWL